MSNPFSTPNILCPINKKSNAFQLYRRAEISMKENNLIQKQPPLFAFLSDIIIKKTFIQFKYNMQKTWSTIKIVL